MSKMVRRNGLGKEQGGQAQSKGGFEASETGNRIARVNQCGSSVEPEHKRRFCLASDMSGAAILQGNLEKSKEEIKALSDVSWVGEQNFKYFAIDWEDRSSFHSITSLGATLSCRPSGVCSSL
jgi:hypothetical protein